MNIRKILLIIAGALVASAVVLVYSWYGAYVTELNSLKAGTASQQVVVPSNVPGQPGETSSFQTKESVDVALSEAKSVVEKIADLQTKCSLAMQATDSSDVDASVQTLMESRTALEAYFGSNRKMTECWYYWDGEAHGNVSWHGYVLQDYSGSRVPLAWLCTDDTTGSVLSYATAEYDVTTQRLEDYDVFVTRLGVRYMPYDEVEVEPSSEVDIEGFLSDVDELIARSTDESYSNGNDPWHDDMIFGGD